MLSSDKDSVTANSVHVNASARLEIIKMNEPVFCDNKDDSIFMADLHGNREVIDSFRREKDFDGLLLERRISFLVVNFNNLKLQRKKKRLKHDARESLLK
jgi:hypothetical protein